MAAVTQAAVHWRCARGGAAEGGRVSHRGGVCGVWAVARCLWPLGQKSRHHHAALLSRAAAKSQVCVDVCRIDARRGGRALCGGRRRRRLLPANRAAARTAARIGTRLGAWAAARAPPPLLPPLRPRPAPSAARARSASRARWGTRPPRAWRLAEGRGARRDHARAKALAKSLRLRPLLADGLGTRDTYLGTSIPL